MVRGLLREGRFGLLHSHGITAAAHAALANLGVGVPHVATLHEPLRANQFPRLARTAETLDADASASARPTRSSPSATTREPICSNIFRPCAPAPIVCSPCPTAFMRSATPCRPSEPASDLRERLGLDAQPFLIGFLGRFMPEKGFPVLLEAVERLAREETVRPFHLVGFGSGDFRREYQKAIQRRGLEKCISLLDFVADVQPVLRQLDLIVVPSLWEASSLVSMEAMAAGVPVLGFDCIGLREVLRDTPSRTVPANDAAALAIGLRAALEEPWTDAARAFAAAAQARFDNRHSVRMLDDVVRVAGERSASGRSPLAA